MVAQGWDGTVLDCEEMPIDVLGSPYSAIAPHEAQVDVMDCADDECTEQFEKCGGEFNQSTLCCDPATECVIKNWYYAQCLPKDRAGVSPTTSLPASSQYCIVTWRSRVVLSVVPYWPGFPLHILHMYDRQFLHIVRLCRSPFYSSDKESFPSKGPAMML
jgi:hypothetical protein